VETNDSSKVREYIVENFLFGEGDSLKEDTSFLEEGIIDSTGILELVMFIEETYGIKIEDDELVPENMDSLKNIAQYLGRKLAESPAAEA
jgi:acyl carrier protein